MIRSRLHATLLMATLCASRGGKKFNSAAEAVRGALLMVGAGAGNTFATGLMVAVTDAVGDVVELSVKVIDSLREALLSAVNVPVALDEVDMDAELDTDVEVEVDGEALSDSDGDSVVDRDFVKDGDDVVVLDAEPDEVVVSVADAVDSADIETVHVLLPLGVTVMFNVSVARSLKVEVASSVKDSVVVPLSDMLNVFVATIDFDSVSCGDRVAVISEDPDDVRDPSGRVPEAVVSSDSDEVSDHEKVDDCVAVGV